MKRSDFFIKAVAVVLFLAIACYLGIYFYISARNPFQTALAVKYTAERSGAADGFVVRDEAVLAGGGGAVARHAGNGEKVAAGQTVATVYFGQQAQIRAGEMRAIQLKIDRLEGRGGSESDLNSVSQLAAAVARRDLGGLDALAFDIEAGLFGKGGEDELSSLTARLRELEAGAGSSDDIKAPASGTYCSETDGFEGVAPGDISGLVPASLEALFDPAAASGNMGAGKLVYGISWYYAAVMAARDADTLSAGGSVEVRFTRPFRLSVRMKVESVGASDNGACVVVFSSKERLRDILSLRSAQAEAVFNLYSGIRIPKEAMRLDDEDRTFIYLLTGQRAERVYVDILTQFADSYIVSDGYITRGGERIDTVLREGAVIIVRANDLSDGKVVNG